MSTNIRMIKKRTLKEILESEKVYVTIVKKGDFYVAEFEDFYDIQMKHCKIVGLLKMLRIYIPNYRSNEHEFYEDIKKERNIKRST